MLYVQVFFFLLYLDVFFWWYFIHEIFVNHVTNQCKWQGNCIESTNRGDGVFSSLCATHQVQFKRMERVTLEPFDRDHAYVSGVFRTLEVSVWSVTQFAKAGIVPTISLRIYFSLLHFYKSSLISLFIQLQIAEIDQRCLVSDKFWTSKVSYRYLFFFFVFSLIQLLVRNEKWVNWNLAYLISWIFYCSDDGRPIGCLYQQQKVNWILCTSFTLLFFVSSSLFLSFS
jgi:hypothetical protein